MLCNGTGRRQEMEIVVDTGREPASKSKRSAAARRKDSVALAGRYDQSEINELLRYQKRLQEGVGPRRIMGRVRTFLHKDGSFVHRSPGWKIPKLESVPRSEHYDRVTQAYRNIWFDILSQTELNPDFAELTADARERIELLERGLFRLPIHKGAFFASSIYEKSSFFGTKTVTIPVRDVKIDEYEKYLRRFIRFGYGWRRPPLKETKEPDALWLINNGLSEIRKKRSKHLGETSMRAFMFLPQKDADLVCSIFLS